MPSTRSTPVQRPPITVGSLRPNPQNPRKISDAKLGMLAKALNEFGDLSGVVFNRRTQRLVGGHQRAKGFGPDQPVTIETTFNEPTRTGTVAEGYIEFQGERFKYREVDWDETREKAANIAANKHGGEWDYPQLSEWLLELDHSNVSFDLVGFSHEEAVQLFAPEGLPAAQEQDEASQKRPVKCPNCGEKFNG